MLGLQEGKVVVDLSLFLVVCFFGCMACRICWFWKTLVLVSIAYKQCEESKAALLSLTLFLPLLCSSFIQLGAASVI
jgi:hypothetical protein